MLFRSQRSPLIGRDKKVADGRIRFVLLKALGHALVRSGVADDDLASVLAA